MAVDKISSIYDVAAIDAETQAVVISIQKAQGAYMGLNDSINKNKATGLSDLSSNSNILDATIQKLNQSINLLNQNLLQMRAAAKSGTAGLSDLEKAERNLAKANSQVNEQIQGFKVQTQAANLAAKNAAKEALGMNDAYQKLVNAYNAAQREAKNLRIEQGLGSAETQAAIAKAKNLNDQLQNTDQSVGQFQRNVGNYGSAFNKFIGPLRTAANILPGLGMSGILLGIGEALLFVAKNAGLFSDSLNDATASSEAFNDALKGGEYKKAVEDVGRLTDEIKLAKEGFLNKNDVLKDYNETLGKSIGQVDSLDAAESNIVKKGNAYIQVTLLKAAANAAQAKSAEEAVKQQKAIQDQQDAILEESPLKRFGNALKQQAISPGGFLGIDPTDPLFIRSLKEDQAKAKKDGDTYLKIADEFREKAAKLAKESGIDLFGGKFDGKNTKDDADKSAKIRLDAIKEELENEAKLYQSFSEDNRFDFGQLQTDQRIAAAKTASAARMQIIDEEAKYEKSKKDITDVEKADIDRKSNEKRKQESLKLEADIAKIQIQQAQKTRDAVDEVNKRSDEQADVQRRPDLLAREEVAQLQGGFDAMQRVRQYQYQEEINGIQDQINKRIITEREGQKKILALTRDNLKSSLEDQAATTQAQLDKLTAGGLAGTKAYDELKKKLAEINAELLKLPKNTKLDNLKKLADDLGKIKDIVANFTGALVAINDIGYEQQKANLESIENQREKNYEKEVDNINNSTLAEEDKANKLKILDAQNAAAKEQYDRKQRELDNKKAKFDKAANIANIIATTAEAVVKALATGGPFAIPLAISVGALGAAQLAKAVATPVPQYASGVDSHPGGLAWVGDGGEHELIQSGGKSWISPNTPTLIDLAKGAKVTPLSDTLNETMYRQMMIQTGQKQQAQSDMTIEEQTRRMVKAMSKNKPRIQVIVKDSSKINAYINQYIRN